MTVERFVVNSMEARVDIVDRRGWMLPLPQDGATCHVMEDYIELVGLIREPAVVEENVRTFPAFNLTGDADRFAGRRGGVKNWRRARIRLLQPVQPDK